MNTHYTHFMKEFFKRINLALTQEEQINIDNIEKTFPLMSYSGFRPETRKKLWISCAEQEVNFGTKTLDMHIKTDFNGNILLISIMTDQFYKSNTGEALHDFYIWCHPNYKEHLNIVLLDNKNSKQEINLLHHVDYLIDILSIALSIYFDKDIPNVSMTLDKTSKIRSEVRKCKKIIEKSDIFPEDGTFSKRELLRLCHLVLFEECSIEQNILTLGVIRGILSVNGLMNSLLATSLI